MPTLAGLLSSMGVAFSDRGLTVVAMMVGDVARAIEPARAYDTIFDLARDGYQDWWFPLAGLPFVAVGVLMIRYPRMLPARGGRPIPRLFRWAWLVFAVLWTVSAAAGTYLDYRRLTTALESGQAVVVAGIVEHFEASPPSRGHESFTVNGQRFSYSDYIVTPGFHRSASHGGPMAEGLRVRITHVKGTIVKLEIQRYD